MTIEDYEERKLGVLLTTSNTKIENFEECLSEKCATCKSCCCESAPCTLSPYEFLNFRDLDYMKSVMETGILTIAPIDKLYSFYIIRPRGKKDSNCVVDLCYHDLNECRLRGKNGCLLDPLTRPTEGLLYIPYKNTGLCKSYIDMWNFAADWERFQRPLIELMTRCEDMEVPIDIPINEETIKTYRLRLLGNSNKDNK